MKDIINWVYYIPDFLFIPVFVLFKDTFHCKKKEFVIK